MSRRLLALVILAVAPAALAAQTVDTAGAGALIAQAMDHSEVMANLRQMSDIIGPRLSGSAAMRRANDWTADRFRAYGLTASLEPYTFGITWERGPASLRLVAPFTRADHRPQLGLDGGHRRQDAVRSRHPGGPVDAGQPGQVQGEGAGSLGASADVVPRLEPRRSRR